MTLACFLGLDCRLVVATGAEASRSSWLRPSEFKTRPRSLSSSSRVLLAHHRVRPALWCIFVKRHFVSSTRYVSRCSTMQFNKIRFAAFFYCSLCRASDKRRLRGASEMMPEKHLAVKHPEEDSWRRRFVETHRHA